MVEHSAAVNLPKKKNNNIELHQNFTGSYKKREGSGLNPKYTEYQKVKT